MNLFNRMFVAAPDLLTAMVFLLAWAAPAIPGFDHVNDLVLAMFLQTFMLFLGFVYVMLLSGDDKSLTWRLGVLTMMTAAAVLILANALHGLFADHTQPVPLGFDFDRPEPLISFAWLYASQFSHLLMRPPKDRDAEAKRMETLLALSIAAFVSSFILAIALPLPPLGLTPEVVDAMHRGDDMWGTHLYMPIAFGAFYFTMQACIKAVVVGAAPRTG